MKPKLNSKVYIVDEEDIYMELVGWLGSTSFVIDQYEIKNESLYFYDDYGKTWVKTLKEAKAILQKKLGPNAKIVKFSDIWWGEDLEVEE